MEPIQIMINGLPGNVTKVITRQVLADRRFKVLPYALTGPEIDYDHCHIDETAFGLIRPEHRQAKIEHILDTEGDFIAVDFTHPSAVNANAEFYCRNALPFVMGTTGGDRQQLMEEVRNAPICAVIAPNMAKQIVGFQAMMAYAAERFPNLFKGYSLTLRESHQAGKADTSGTAKAMVGYFNRMGVDFTTDQIEKERDPERQRNMWGVPPAYLEGHGWHTYTLLSGDQTAKFEFIHNINGREIYGEGTMDAIVFLQHKVSKGSKGKVYSMIDVLEGGGEG
jgi:4-hydroxy-tetrahydrodipicolinate reductase